MAKTAQEKLDEKKEKEYKKTHKNFYKTKPGDVLFNVCLLYTSPSPRDTR